MEFWMYTVRLQEKELYEVNTFLQLINLLTQVQELAIWKKLYVFTRFDANKL